MHRRWTGIVALLWACRPPERPPMKEGTVGLARPPTSGPSGLPSPPLGAFEGSVSTVVVADRDLGPGDRVDRLAGGEWSALGRDGRQWVDPDRSPRYRLVGPAGVRAETPPASLAFSLAPGPARRWLSAGEPLPVEISVALPPSPPLALVVRREDGAILDPSCGPCWREGDLATLGPLDLARGAALSIPGAPGPGSTRLRADLVLAGDLDVTLASESLTLTDLGVSLAWGDLHGHTNLSHDGCENVEDYCLPRHSLPAVDQFDEAARSGLDFAAITDHAEHGTYTRNETGESVDVHDYTLDLVAEADGGPVVPILGYEWTGVYTGGGHRTVLIEEIDACLQWRIPASRGGSGKSTGPQFESLTSSTVDVADTPPDLTEALGKAPRKSGCADTRWVAYFHHPAYQPPRAVDWTNADNVVSTDTVVEILSEHGCSECADLDAEGCRWQVHEEWYEASGSVQSALSLGFRFGFVGGTDNHEARPGSVADGPGPVWSTGGAQRHYAPGAISGVFFEGTQIERHDVFDAIEDRATVASSWPFSGVHVLALDAGGTAWLPGQEVPAGTLDLVVFLDDPEVGDIVVELLDETGASWIREESPLVELPFDLGAGDVRYVRVRAWVDGEERRMFASPFFGVEGG